MKTRTTRKRIYCLLLTMMLLFASVPVAFATGETDHDFETIVQAFVAEHSDTTAAVSLAVFTNEDVLMEEAFGHLNIAENRENTLDAVFEWGSATKLLLPVAIFQLYEQGRIDLHGDIRTYLPEGFLTGLRYDTPITLLHLLNHTAGFQEQLTEIMRLPGSGFRTLHDAVYILQPPQVFEPGTHTAYSNFGSALAGYIIERVAGMPFHVYAQRYIFAPIGMTQTAILPDLSDNVWVREQRQFTYTYTTALQSMGLQNNYIQWYPAGMATGTISDFRKFAQALLPNADGGSVLFTYPETLHAMHTPTTYLPDGITSRNHHGFWREPQLAGSVIGHGGNTVGMSAMLQIDIDNNLGLVVLTNQASETVYNMVLPTEVFGFADFSQIGLVENDVPINGMFRSTRAVFSGMLRMSSLMPPGIMPISPGEAGVFTIPAFGTLNRVAPGVYLTSRDSMMPYFPLFASVDETGNLQYLTMAYFDMVFSPARGVVFELIMAVLLLLAGVYGLLAFVWTLILKVRKKEQSFIKLRLSLYATLPLVVVNLLVLLMNHMAFEARVASNMMHGILFLLLALIICALVVMAFLKLKQPDLTKREQRQLIVPSIMGFIVLANIIYWQLFMFWV